MGIYNQNGVCLSKNYRESEYVYNFGNIDSIIEKHEWEQGYVIYNEVITVLKSSLEKNKDSLSLKKLIDRIEKKITDDEWYFFELLITSYDGINVDNITYLPIKM